LPSVVAFNGGLLVGTAVDRPSGLRPLVFLHGWRRDRNDFMPLISEAGGVALDLPGFGSSPPPPDAWGAREFAACVATGIEPVVAAAGPAIVVGHSFGGRVAVCLAASNPELVSGLVVVGSPLLRGVSSRPHLSIRFARRAHTWGLLSDRRMEQMRYTRGSDDYRASSGVMRGVLVRVVNEEYPDELGRLTCTTRFVWGSRDTAAPIDLARRAAEMTSCPIVFHEWDGGHDVHLSHAAQLLAVVREIEELV
jgi:pimeloyl-ACP methyl ester carboxylesterase